MAYDKQNWNDKTWEKGQSNLQDMLNHAETGIDSAGGSAKWSNITGDILQQADLQAALAKKTELPDAELGDRYLYVNSAGQLEWRNMSDRPISLNWGNVGGLISDQTDLTNALLAKQDKIITSETIVNFDDGTLGVKVANESIKATTEGLYVGENQSLAKLRFPNAMDWRCITINKDLLTLEDVIHSKQDKLPDTVLQNGKYLRINKTTDTLEWADVGEEGDLIKYVNGKPGVNGRVTVYGTDILVDKYGGTFTIKNALAQKQDKFIIGEVDKNKYLHTNATTGALEWKDIVMPTVITDFNDLNNRPKYNNVLMTGSLNIPEVKTAKWDAYETTKQDILPNYVKDMYLHVNKYGGYLEWVAVEAQGGGGGGTTNWGSIGGTLSNQTDLNNALLAKQDLLPSRVSDTYLHVNKYTGALEWSNISVSGIAWGSITGTLSDQTDLQRALNGKQTTIADSGTIVNNLDGTLTVKTTGGNLIASTTGLKLSNTLTDITSTTYVGNSWTMISNERETLQAALNAKQNDLVSSDTITVDQTNEKLTVRQANSNITNTSDGIKLSANLLDMSTITLNATDFSCIKLASSGNLQEKLNAKQKQFNTGEGLIYTAGTGTTPDSLSAVLKDVQINGSTVVTNKIALIPVAGTNTLGVVKYSQSTGLTMESTTNTLGIISADTGNIASRTAYKNTGFGAITTANLNDAVIAALSDNNKITLSDTQKQAASLTILPSISNDMYLHVNNTGALEWASMTGGVSDVKINNNSIVSGGVANIPVATSSVLGVAKVDNTAGTKIDSNAVCVVNAEDTNITARKSYKSSGYGVVSTANFDAAVKAHLTDGKAAAYSEAEQTAARARISAIGSNRTRIQVVETLPADPDLNTIYLVVTA